ncbi:hypothetical protein SVAN01_03171 [Stagonosporopsis vannaccii]|nr:hypothetical protein SVAN01_03171 [Stagonosporopsis vannaccii]
MLLNHLLGLIGFATCAAARALPVNTSSSSTSNETVQTAGTYQFYDPNNIASDAWWDKYREKGNHYQCLFEADDEAAGRLVEDTRVPPSCQSIWKGSMYGNYFDEDNCDFEALHLKDAFDALKLNAYCLESEVNTGHNVGWSLGHYDETRVDESDPNGFSGMLPPVKQTYTVDGQTYKSTGGYYSFVVNQVDGVIVALDINSPRNAAQEHWKPISGTIAPEELPKLQYGSDLMWGKWVEGNTDVKNLRFYVVNNIINDETSALVSRAMRNKLVRNLAVWPGTTFEKDMDAVEFQALIGSPIGGTIAIMLAQHKAELGNKEVYQINVVSDSYSTKPHQVTELHMFFHIRDVPPSKPNEGEQEESLVGDE